MIWDSFLTFGYIGLFFFIWGLPSRLDDIEEAAEHSEKQRELLERQLHLYTARVWKIDSKSLDKGLLTFTELQILASQGKIQRETLLIKMNYKPGSEIIHSEQKLVASEVEGLQGLFAFQDAA